eukprot:5582233-Pyramimonas_sp.AAC.1
MSVHVSLRRCLCHTSGSTVRRCGEFCNVTSFYGSSCANTGKDALNTPDVVRFIISASASGVLSAPLPCRIGTVSCAVLAQERTRKMK